MDDLRTMLRDKAEEMRLDPEMPAALERRARRRRTGTVVLSALIVLGMGLGSYAGLRAVLNERAHQGLVPAEPPVEGPAGEIAAEIAAELVTWIYPADPEQLQHEAEQGGDQTWLDPEQVAISFAEDVLGWDPADVLASVRGDDPPQVVVANPSLATQSGAPSDLRIVLEMRQWGGPDDTIYYVRHARADILDLEPPTIETADLHGPPSPPPDTLTLEGTLGFIPQGGKLTAELRSSSDHAEVEASATSSFSFELRRVNQTQGAPFFGSVTLRDASGATLAYSAHPVEYTFPQGQRSLKPCEQGAPPAPAVDFQDGPEALFPQAAAKTRAALTRAANDRDWRALEGLIPESGFTFSFGGERDPIAFWKTLEASGTPVLEILETLLCYTGSEYNGVFIFPEAAEKHPKDWTEGDMVPLREIYSEEELEQIKSSDAYYGWRVGIEPDGDWSFFVAGD